MTLDDARKMAQEDADQYGVEINVIYDELSEEETPYGFCSVELMEHFHPQIHKDFWKILEVIKPKYKRFVSG